VDTDYIILNFFLLVISWFIGYIYFVGFTPEQPLEKEPEDDVTYIIETIAICKETGGIYKYWYNDYFGNFSVQTELGPGTGIDHCSCVSTLSIEAFCNNFIHLDAFEELPRKIEKTVFTQEDADNIANYQGVF